MSVLYELTSGGKIFFFQIYLTVFDIYGCFKFFNSFYIQFLFMGNDLIIKYVYYCVCSFFSVFNFLSDIAWRTNKQNNQFKSLHLLFQKVPINIFVNIFFNR